MQPRVERKRFLAGQLVGPSRALTVKDQVPATRRNRTRDDHEQMVGQQAIAEGLLASARNSRHQTVRVWDFGPSDDMDQGRIKNLYAR